MQLSVILILVGHTMDSDSYVLDLMPQEVIMEKGSGKQVFSVVFLTWTKELFLSHWTVNLWELPSIIISSREVLFTQQLPFFI